MKASKRNQSSVLPLGRLRGRAKRDAQLLLALLTVFSLLIAPLAPLAVPSATTAAATSTADANPLADLFTRAQALVGLPSLTSLTLLYNNFFAAGTAAAQSGAPGGVNTNLVLWLKADAGTSSTSDGTLVTTWSDQSASGNNATEPTNAPAFANNSTDNINFNPALRFDGADDRLNLGNLTAIKGGGSYALLSVGVREDNSINAVVGPTSGATNQTTYFGYRGNTEATLGQWNNDLNVTVAAFDAPALTPYLLFGEFDSSSGHLVQQVRDRTFATNSNTNLTGLSGTIASHIARESGNYYNGRINEVIIYNKALSAAEENQIQSYLALKYGITLVGSSNSPRGYVNSAGTTLWDATANASYHNRVAGIGRDDSSGLNQKQSHSSGVDSGVTISLGTLAASNQANSSSFGSNQQFLIWGDNGLAASFATSYTPTSFTPILSYARMSRVWKVAETGALGAVNVIKSDVDHLLVSNDPTFATGVTEIALNSGSASVNFASGQYFTFGKELKGPGGVNTNLVLWLKADAGTSSTSNGATVTSWLDQSANGNNATEPTNAPAFANNSTDNINFNPALRFDGANDRLNLGNLTAIKGGAAMRCCRLACAKTTALTRWLVQPAAQRIKQRTLAIAVIPRPRWGSGIMISM